MEEQKQRGRPSKFNEDLVSEIFELISQGKTDEEIAESIGIGRATLSRWKVKYPEFRDAIKDAKGAIDDLVENSLFKRCMGMTFTDTSQELYEGRIFDLESVRHIPPDTRAIEFWLKNRRPEEWREKQQIEHSNPDGKFAPLAIITMPSNGRDKPEAE